jgi:hypothetical protein
MDFSIYSHPRTFRMPHLKTTVTVGGDAILWALFTGPFYFWRRGAMVAALVVGIATLPFWLIDLGNELWDAVAGLVYIGSAFLAPALVAASYDRRGWVDVTVSNRSQLIDPEDDEALDAWSREREEADLRLAHRRQSQAWETEESELE